MVPKSIICQLAGQKGKLYCSSAAQPAFLPLEQLLTAVALARRALQNMSFSSPCWRREVPQLPPAAAAKSKT